nr:MAG TPA: hypothetical protein [Caudoviricetes sp.]
MVSPIHLYWSTHRPIVVRAPTNSASYQPFLL